MTDTSTRTVRQLAGVWRLVTSEFRSASGDVMYPLGEDALGLAIFDESGYMSAQLMRQNRPAFAAGNQAQGTAEEIQQAFQGYAAYYGRCEVDPERQTITTHVEGSVFPNWVGGEQVRFYELNDNQLVLRTPAMKIGDDEITGVLTWERQQATAAPA